MVQLHGERGATLGHGSQIVLIIQHFGHRDLRPNELRGALGVHTLNPAAAAVEVAHEVAGIFHRGLDLHVHDRLQQGRLGLLHGGFESLAGGQLERQFRGVDVVIRAVI